MRFSNSRVASSALARAVALTAFDAAIFHRA
jgi:hypothetical protein